MNLYKDGEFVEVFNKPRDIDTLREYVKSHAEPKKAPAARQPATVIEEEEFITEDSGTVHNLDGKVMILNEKNFESTIQEGHVFVKFYAPWYV